MDANKLYQSLHAAGYNPCAYSGRGMYGVECVAIYLDDASELLEVGASVKGAGKPHTDNLGKGIVAYWPEALMSEVI
jgi:hypothetical protein